MNIVNVITSLSFGGAETQVINLSKELVSQGHRVTIITTTNFAPRSAELEGSGVTLICLDKKRKFDVALILKLRRALRDIKPDIVHAYLYDAEFFTRLASIGLGCPVINSERNDEYQLNLNQKVGHLSTRFLVNGVIANSYAGYEHAKKKYPKQVKNNLHVVWNGIDVERVMRRVEESNLELKKELFPNDSGIKLAVMVASIKHQKNHELALEVANELVNRNEAWRVVFVGDELVDSKTEHKAKIFNLYNQLNCKDKVIFLGNRKDVVEILHQTDISFLTSHHEGFPNTVLESMAVGTPVVTTGFSDIQKIAVKPWLVNEDNSARSFVDTLVKAENNRVELSKESAEWVLNNCDIKIAAKNLINVYRTYSS